MDMNCFVSLEINVAKAWACDALARIEISENETDESTREFLYQRYNLKCGTWWGRYIQCLPFLLREEHDRKLKKTGFSGCRDWLHWHDKQLVKQVMDLMLISHTNGWVQLSPAHIVALTKTYEPFLQKGSK